MAAAMLAVVLFMGATVTAATAQTYTVLYSFDVTHGANPTFSDLLAQGQDGNLYGTVTIGGANYIGVVFKITPSGTLTVLYDFDSTHGNHPRGGLTLGKDGSFFGTAEAGGASDFGTIFNITPTGSLTTLYDFVGGSDGVYPKAPPVQGTDGNFYGTTQTTAYKISPAGRFSGLGNLPGFTFAPLILGSDGNFYGTSYTGGSQNKGAVFKLNSTGKIATLYSCDGTHGLNPVGPLVQGNDGNFYGTTLIGGTSSGGVVFKLTPQGVLTVLYNFDSVNTLNGYAPYGGLVLASDGNLYGVTASGGISGDGVIFKITPAGSYSVLYNFDGTHGLLPYATPTQHTNGKIYGLTYGGGAYGYGVVYSFDVGLKAFVNVTSAAARVGQTVGIIGQGLTGTTSVKFNGTPATFKLVSDTYLMARVPAGATSGFVTVTTPGGTLRSSKRFRIMPVILSFSPTSGAEGTPVIITGTSFTGATKVTFGGVRATTFSVDSDTQVTATVPAGAKTGKIQITTPGGTATSATNFTVTP
jgi:uncharacterized repeat protein (TIGR03803 family)